MNRDKQTSALVAEARQLLDAATPGEWLREPSGEVYSVRDDQPHADCIIANDAGVLMLPDAEFIAAAPRLVRQLADLCDQQAARLREVEAELLKAHERGDKGWAAFGDADRTVDRLLASLEAEQDKSLVLEAQLATANLAKKA